MLLISSQLKAQSGSLYNFYFKVDQQLTDYFKTEDKARSWFSGWSESESMPEQLIDSIKKITEERFTSKLGIPVKCCYHKNKKGENIGTIGISGILEGLPGNTIVMLAVDKFDDQILITIAPTGKLSLFK